MEFQGPKVGLLGTRSFSPLSQLEVPLARDGASQIHQNIAARQPGLSGHLRFRPFDQVFELILAVYCPPIFLHFPTSY
jgi:hypothetical protein